MRPTSAQQSAFQHFIDDQEAIRDAVLQAVFEVYPKWRGCILGTLSEMFTNELMPPISQPADLRHLVRLGTVHVTSKERDGVTAVGLSFSCKWDEEHGLGVLTHKGKVLDVGQARVSFQEIE